MLIIFDDSFSIVKSFTEAIFLIGIFLNHDCNDQDNWVKFKSIQNQNFKLRDNFKQFDLKRVISLVNSSY